MNWSSGEDTTKNIQYSINNGSSWTNVGAVNAKSGNYTISGLNPYTTYNIKTRITREDGSTADTSVSSGTMAQKFGSAISGALVATLLGVAGFVSGTDPATGQTVVTITNEPSVQRMIWLIFSLFPAAIALLIVLLLRLYPIKK